MIVQIARSSWSLLLALVLSSCGGMSGSGPGLEESTNRAVLQRVNQERGQRGLPPVRPDAGLARIARGHADWLVRSVDPRSGKPPRSVAHQGFSERAKWARSQGYLVLQEVVMVGYAGNLRAVADRSVRGWLSSPSHRKAILEGDRSIMGVATRILDDQRYFVVGLLSNGRIGRPIPLSW